jgi:hypothetical protein
VAKELEASVPALERITFMLFSRERLMWRLMVVIGLFVSLIGTGLVLPALGKLKRVGTLDEKVLLVMIGMVIVVSGLHLLGWGIARRMRKTT